MKKHLVVLLIGLLISSHNAFAEEEKKEQINLVGAGVLVSTSPYAGEDSKIFAVPIGVWRNERFFIEGIKGGVIVAESDDFRADVLFAPRLMGYEADDASVFNGMKDRNISVDGGVQLKWKMPYSDKLSFTVALLQDLLNEHQGHEISAELAKVFRFSFFQIIPKAGVKWLNEDIVDHYFGVTGEEITPNRPQYGGHDTFNYYGNVSLYMAVHPKWFIVLRGGVELLGDEIQDSPLVDESVTYNGVLGLTYRF